ncbi:MAG TPA: IS5 family transposase [Candidatus Competibacter sp.]|nr:IS5 family transposase [Candidatus Competibacter sp.]
MNSEKQSYRIRNWREYNAALVARGSLTVWFDEDQISQWYEQEATGRRGASNTYSGVAIECGLVMREVFHLPLRATEGFIGALVKLLGLPLKVPDHSTFSRRGQDLEVLIGRSASTQARHIVIDSSGLKVYGEGEWKVRQHGVGKRRTWRKLHLAVDADSQEAIAVELTAAFVGDAEVLPDLLDQLDPHEPIEAVSADSSYDTRRCHEAIGQRGARALIPPRAGAVEWPDLADGQTHPRTAILRQCQQQGEKHWKQTSGYHRRSLAETAMFRIKTLFGPKLKNRRFDTQTTEAYARVAAMNIMTRLGMPDSYEVAA